MDFDKLLVKMFACAPEQYVFEFPDDIRDALHHVQQVITATIVNSHAAYYIKNQRRAYQNRRAETELQWWGTAATHDDPGTGLHAMAATVAQTYGNPNGNESDEDGNGRAPRTGGSTGAAVHSGSAAGGGAPAARPSGTGAQTSTWGGRGGGVSRWGGGVTVGVVQVGKGVVGVVVGRGHLLMGVAK